MTTRKIARRGIPCRQSNGKVTWNPHIYWWTGIVLQFSTSWPWGQNLRRSSPWTLDDIIEEDVLDDTIKGGESEDCKITRLLVSTVSHLAISWSTGAKQIQRDNILSKLFTVSTGLTAMIKSTRQALQARGNQHFAKALPQPLVLFSASESPLSGRMVQLVYLCSRAQLYTQLGIIMLLHVRFWCEPSPASIPNFTKVFV